MSWGKWSTLAVFAVTGALLGLSTEASAQVSYRRQSATYCMPITNTYQDVRSNSGAVGNGGTNPLRLVCPIHDDSAMDKVLVSYTNVDVYDGSTVAAVDARACVTYWSSMGGACDSAAASSVSGTGMTTLSPPVSVWAANPSHYGYYVINLPIIQSGRVSALHGYELYD